MRRRSSGTLISGAARLWPWPRTWASPRPQRPGRSQNTSAAGHERRRSTMSLIHLSTELRQELKLTPQLLQSMERLQMNSQELLEYLKQVSEENPLVEQTELSELHKAYEALRQQVDWLNGGLPEDGPGAMPERGVTDRETESLSAFLCDQLERRRMPKPLLALCRYLAELVDEEGRLSQEDLDGVAD